jgi:hypothetical protein
MRPDKDAGGRYPVGDICSGTVIVPCSIRTNSCSFANGIKYLLAIFRHHTFECIEKSKQYYFQYTMINLKREIAQNG